MQRICHRSGSGMSRLAESGADAAGSVLEHVRLADEVSAGGAEPRDNGRVGARGRRHADRRGVGGHPVLDVLSVATATPASGPVLGTSGHSGEDHNHSVQPPVGVDVCQAGTRPVAGV